MDTCGNRPKCPASRGFHISVVPRNVGNRPKCPASRGFHISVVPRNVDTWGNRPKCPASRGFHILGVPRNVDTWGIGHSVQYIGVPHFNFCKIGLLCLIAAMKS